MSLVSVDVPISINFGTLMTIANALHPPCLQCPLTLFVYYSIIIGEHTVYFLIYSGVSKGGLRVLEHPPQLWHNSQISS